MFKNILVPLDGSENAEKVLPFVKSQAQLQNAKVIVIRVIPPLRPAIMSIPTVVERVDENIMGIVNDYLDNIKKSLEAQGLEVDTVIEKGHPAERILQYIEKTECDLIIIGTQGYTHSLRWRTGSVSINIIRAGLDIPVLLIPT